MNDSRMYGENDDHEKNYRVVPTSDSEVISLAGECKRRNRIIWRVGYFDVWGTSWVRHGCMGNVAAFVS